MPTCEQRLCINKLPRFDPRNNRFRLDPYQEYNRYRSIGSIHWGKPSNPGLPGAWYLFSYSSVRDALKSPVFSREAHRYKRSTIHPNVRHLFSHVNKWVMFRDPPYHHKLRSALIPAFSHEIADKLSHNIQDIARLAVNRCMSTTRFEVMSDFSIPLSRSILALFSGISDTELQNWQIWIHELSLILDFKREINVYDNADSAAQNLSHVIRKKILEPQKNDQTTLLWHLQNAVKLENLSENEAISTLMLILVTGHETLRNLICNSILAILEMPVGLIHLSQGTVPENIFVNELLRVASPVHMSGRIAVENTMIENTNIRQGDAVIACLAAANRDPIVFPNPNHIDFTRDNLQTMSFGNGIHACIGQWIARNAIKIVIATLTPHLSRLHIVDTPVWRHTVLFRSLRSLKVEVLNCDRPIKSS